MLKIYQLSVKAGDHEIVHNLGLSIQPKEIHILMGRNGSGKSTLSLTLAGHPHYTVDSQAKVSLDNTELLSLTPDRRARAGLFLSFQHPITIPGLSVRHLLKIMSDQLFPKPAAVLREEIDQYCRLLEIDPEFLSRSVNDGFSGGEKKRLEMLQLLLAQPKYAILDEIDSGLDIDAIKQVAQAVAYACDHFSTGFLIITHYRRIIDHLEVDRVHVLAKGNVIKSGGKAVIDDIEKSGYTHL